MNKSDSPAIQPKIDARTVLWLRLTCVGLLIAGMLLVTVTLRTKREHSHSFAWPTTTGKIIASELREYAVRKGTAYEATVGYSYKVAEQRYVSYQISLWKPKLRGEGRDAKDFVSEHAVGSDVVVYFDSSNPKQSVLIPGNDSKANNVSIWGGVAVVLVSTGILIAMRRANNERLLS